MKTIRYSDAQSLAILLQDDGGMTLAKMCREDGMRSDLMRWMSPPDGIECAKVISLEP